jgi:hypothetical protein
MSSHQNASGVRSRIAGALAITAHVTLFTTIAHAQTEAEQPQPVPAQLGEQPEPPAKPKANSVAIDLTGDVEVLLNDGRRITGRLAERTDEFVVITVAGLPARFNIADISEITPMRPVEERHKELRSGIDDTDEERLLNLAEWARSKGRLDLALEDVAQVLKVNPSNEAAARLKTLIDAQIELERRKKDDARGAESDAGAKPERTKFPLLNEDDINIIRVYEVDLADPPRMSISQEAVKSFIDTYAGQGPVPSSKDGKETFARRSVPRILSAMFELQAREFYAEVKILENPKRMRDFRDDVQRWLVPSCATTECHGGNQGGRLRLHNKRQNADASAYTNFYILDRFRTEDGLALIDYDTPNRSPLLQFGLPREEALYKHPELAADGRNSMKPIFKSERDDRFQATVEWITSMYQPRPEYPIEYSPLAPFSAPTTEKSGPTPR